MEPMIGGFVFSTVNYNASLTDALKSLFETRGLSLADSDSDLVIDQFDQWRNPEGTSAAFSAVTFNLAVVAQH